ncbi:hypothetical protein AVEN_184610-1 [Araneus ventricosus]|uniref:Uncharacterized protein n=1 Tax=Araneus ventricosus TaxID=182803 RepID=A0A4Y2E8U9_ARAVE|nr:hypothetical protein AVEN_184610-1 [Araneus ventricosus]
MAKLIKKFKRTASIGHANTSRRQKTATGEGTSTQVRAAVVRILTKRTGSVFVQVEISQSSAMRNLLINKWHPDRQLILQHLIEEILDPREEIYECTLNMHENVPGQNCLNQSSLCDHMKGRHFGHVL